LAGAGPSTNFLRLLPAAIVSAVVHVGLFGLLLLVTSPETKGNARIEKPAPDDDKNVTQEQQKPKPPEEDPPPPEDTVKDIDDDAKDADIEIQYNTKRVEEKSAPGDVSPNDPVGVETGRDDPVTSIAAPSGIGGKGVGGAVEGPGDGTSLNIAGGYGLGGKMAGTFYGRSGATKKDSLREGGGTDASEAAVNLGLEWIYRHQSPDGHWSLDGFHRHGHCNCRNRGNHNNDIAATAFGLLPLLGYGYTHKPSKDTPEKYRKAVLKGLGYLMRKQNRTNGDFGGGMYAHGLATIAICEAYGLTQDRNLKASAQAAVNYIARAQDLKGGGWRYAPHQAGDISVVGWQVMALKSAQMANLNVPARTLKKAIDFLDSIMADADKDYGYGYTDRGQSSETRTAIGLLCRLYLQNLGPATKIMSKGVANWLDNYPPTNAKNMYYFYYATQVKHHLGGAAWDRWNTKMRDALIREQITPKNQEQWKEQYKHELGSWSPEGDPHGGVGGRLMITSLSILTLEVYYRHLPLYKRETVLDKKDLAAK
jgi:hypothetical protein